MQRLTCQSEFPRRGASVRRRLGGVLGVLIVLLGGLLQGVHEVSVEHRVCEVHDQVEHVSPAVEAGHTGHPEHSAQLLSAAERGGPRLEVRGPLAEEHAACGLDSFLRERDWVTPQVTLAFAPGRLSASSALAGARERRQPIAVLRLSPKHSPPA